MCHPSPPLPHSTPGLSVWQLHDTPLNLPGAVWPSGSIPACLSFPKRGPRSWQNRQQGPGRELEERGQRLSWGYTGVSQELGVPTPGTTTVAAKTTTKHPQRPPCLSLPRVAGSSGGGEGSANRNGSLRSRSKHSAPGDPPRARPLALPSKLHLPGPPFAKPATHRPLHLCPPLSVARGFAYALQAQRRAQSAWHTASGQ